MIRLSRRRFAVQAATFGTLGVAESLTSNAAQSSTFSWGEPPERLTNMIRIMGRTDGKIGIRWTHGVLAGVVNQETEQILGVSQQIFSRHRKNEDGSYDAVYLEFVYFSDLTTGEVLEKWNNPYTGRIVDVPVQILGPVEFHLPVDLKVENKPFPMEGLVNNHWLEPLPPIGDDVTFHERIDSYVPPMVDGGAPLNFHEVFAFRAAMTDVRNKDLSHVDATVDKVNVISWRPWMDMDDVDGVTMSRGAGRVIANYEDLPEDLKTENRKHFPDVVDELDDYVEIQG